jgi:putative exporter of polyketide antibiotics
MIGILIRKELRQLIPIAFLLLAVIGSDVIFRSIDGRLDEASWVDISGWTPGENTSHGVLYLLFGLVTAYSLFPREHDEGTIQFLNSLPVSRLSVFTAKFIAAFLILEAFIVLGAFSDWALQLPNHQSFTGHQFRFGVAASATFIASVYSFITLSHWILLSFFRRFGLIIYGIFWWVVWTLEKLEPEFKFLNIMNLYAFEFHLLH